MRKRLTDVTNFPFGLRAIQRWWLAIFGIVSIGLALVYLDDMVADLKEPKMFRAQYLLLAAILHLIFWALLAHNWRQVVLDWSRVRIPLSSAYAQWVLVNFGKYIPGKIWGIVARGSRLGRHGVKPTDIVTATLYEQALLLHSGVILSVCLGAALFEGSSFWLAAATAAIGSAFFGNRLLMIGSKLLYALAHRLDVKIATARDLSSAGTVEYLTLLVRYGALWILSGLILVSLYLCFFSDHLDMRALVVLMLANTVGIVTGFVAIFAPAGIGAREITMAAMLTAVMGPSDAVLLSVVSRLWLVVADISGAGGALLLAKSGKILSP